MTEMSRFFTAEEITQHDILRGGVRDRSAWQDVGVAGISGSVCPKCRALVVRDGDDSALLVHGDEHSRGFGF